MSKRTIAEISKRIKEGTMTSADWEAFQRDERKGVQKLLERYLKEKEKKAEQKAQFEEKRQFEIAWISQGKQAIAGIDEAGRGPLAGPVVAGAVILPEGFYLEGLDDSKKLSLKKREAFFCRITEEADWGVGVVSSEEIDRLNIYQATKLAMKRAVEQLPVSPDHLLIDAMEIDYPACSQTSLVKGDQRSVSIAAASVIAKVTRDRYMAELEEAYPGYHFRSNQGYGTSEHLEALRTLGATPAHRKSFAPVKSVL
ncbi:ribonuclease HII [Halobacillus sp. ACCC02827]|uniref:ribonuclease HII n=1 Tax=Halobacillus sp. ACCC02827 TaxID=3052090 RepID=UPI0025710F0E|nr:ribonuclease HII [Halobacillus sp. ACCC02827]WJE17453.1 ribonuclease HII [Halobacillus sp. ACCC02827]